MANICSVSFELLFKNRKDKNVFKKAFQKKIDAANKRDEGVRIAHNKWLFDSMIDDIGNRILSIYGNVRWYLEEEVIEEFHSYLKKMKVVSYTCDYEECGNMIFGRYEYRDGHLRDKYIPDDHPIWNDAEELEDEYFEILDSVLENDGITQEII